VAERISKNALLFDQLPDAEQQKMINMLEIRLKELDAFAKFCASDTPLPKNKFRCIKTARAAFLGPNFLPVENFTNCEF
jgi:hypothetical protein